MIRRAFGNPPKLSREFAPVVALNAPTLLPEVLSIATDSAPTGLLLQKLAYFLETGDASREEELHEVLIQCIREVPSPFCGSLLRSSRIALSHLVRLSVARVLRGDVP